MHTHVFEGCTQPLLYKLLLDSVDVFWCCMGLLASLGIPCSQPSLHTWTHAHLAVSATLAEMGKRDPCLSVRRTRAKLCPALSPHFPPSRCRLCPRQGTAVPSALTPARLLLGAAATGCPRSRLTLPLPALTPRPLPSSLWGARDRRGSIKGQECRSGCHGRARRAAGAALRGEGGLVCVSDPDRCTSACLPLWNPYVVMGN